MKDSHSLDRMERPLGPIVMISIGLLLGFFVGYAFGAIIAEPLENNDIETTEDSFGFDSTLSNLPEYSTEDIAVFDGTADKLCYVSYAGYVFDVSKVDTFDFNCGTDIDGDFTENSAEAQLFYDLIPLGLYSGGANLQALTTEELSNFDGIEGRLCYTVFGGFVYDVTGSPLFENGEHPGGVKCGRDDSAALENAPHGEDVFEGFDIVGTYAE